MQRCIPCTIMRGGTSKGVFFKAHDLPADIAGQDRMILAVFGSPDRYGRQIDGLGGATSTTSKMAVISPRDGEVNTIDYTFGQVSISSALVDRNGNCGNISSAVGPYAIDEGMVEIQEPVTTVRVYNTNTKKYITAKVAVEGGKAKVKGDYRMAGVPGTGASIALGFEQPGGAVTGRLLPTGRPRDLLQTMMGDVEVSIVDAANPLVFVRARDLGLKGWELPVAVDSDPDLLARLESVRAAAAVKMGLASDPAEATRNSPSVPKVAFISPTTEYMMTSGMRMPASDIDLVARIMSMGRLHSTYAVTGAICTAGATKIAGTVMYDMITPESRASSRVRLGHPSGEITVDVELETGTPEPHYVCATVYRTARRIMEGFVYVPESLFVS